MIKRRKVFILFMGISIFCIPFKSASQNADQIIGNLLNTGDWFALESTYPKIKDNIQSPMLKRMSEVLICSHFNQPEKAVNLIDSLLIYHQGEIGFDNVCNMVALKSTLYAEQGLYAQSADVAGDFLDQISNSVPKENFPAQIALFNMYNPLRNTAKTAIIRPDKATELPFEVEQAGRGSLMFVPVTIHGKTYRFIFDTGAGTTFVSERFSNEIGLHVMYDSLTISGLEKGIGKWGIIDSLIVGDIIFRSPVIAIAPPNPQVDTVYQIDAVLGMDFITRIGEVQILPKESKLLFPVNDTPLPATGRNMYFSNRQPYVRVFSEKQPLLFHMDTGNTKSDLYNTYYQKHTEHIEKHSVKNTVQLGGFGGIKQIEGYKLPHFNCTLGNVEFTLHNIDVMKEKTHAFQEKEDGALGMDFFLSCRKVILNFNNMFIAIEK